MNLFFGLKIMYYADKNYQKLFDNYGFGGAD